MTTTPNDPTTALPGRPPVVDLATWQAAVTRHATVYPTLSLKSYSRLASIGIPAIDE